MSCFVDDEWRGIFQFRSTELAERQRNGGRSEDELDERGCGSDVSAGVSEGALGIGEEASGAGDGCGEFSEAEDEGRVHAGHENGGEQEAERAGAGPSVATAEVFAGDDEADGDAP